MDHRLGISPPRIWRVCHPLPLGLLTHGHVLHVTILHLGGVVVLVVHGGAVARLIATRDRRLQLNVEVSDRDAVLVGVGLVLVLGVVALGLEAGERLDLLGAAVEFLDDRVGEVDLLIWNSLAGLVSAC